MGWDPLTGNAQNKQVHKQTWIRDCWVGRGGEVCSWGQDLL